MKKPAQALLIGLSASAVAISLWLSSSLDRFENTAWVWRVRAFDKPSPATDHIKLILLDQASLDWGAQENGLSWPWPRQVYAPIIDFCVRGGAKAVAFDVLYTESSAYGVEDDVALGDAAKRAGNFVAAVFLGEQAEQAKTWPEGTPEPTVDIHVGNAATITESGAAFPVPELATNAALLANVKDVPDDDGVFRRAGLARVFDGRALPSLGLAAYLKANPVRVSLGNGSASIGDIVVPTDSKHRAILRFRGPSGTHQTFSAAAVLQSELRIQEGGTPAIDPAVFKDAYVLFGFSAPGLKDLRPTPIAGDYPGVEIHATFLDNLLERDFLRDAGKLPVAALTILLSILAAWWVIHSRSAAWSVLAFVIMIPIPVVAGFGGYVMGLWWPIVVGLLAVVLALVAGVVVNYATEGRQKRFIKSAFKQYLGESVIDEIIADPSKLRLGGEKRQLTMFFSDLEKFSSFSERLDPPALIDLLNAYLTEMGEVLMEEGAYVDKFIGDAIVAFWNAPASQPDHAARAVRAAIKCQRRLKEKQAEFAGRAGAPVRMRIGLNSGDVVVGNMGSAARFNYTMLGDAANLASRLEGVNKAFGTFILVSGATWEQAKGEILGRHLGAVQVVGRKKPVEVYEAMALAGEPLGSWVADFEKGVALCREQKWAEALAMFERFPDDPPSQKYVARLRELLSTKGEWDGVWSLTEK